MPARSIHRVATFNVVYVVVSDVSRSDADSVLAFRSNVLLRSPRVVGIVWEQLQLPTVATADDHLCPGKLDDDVSKAIERATVVWGNTEWARSQTAVPKLVIAPRHGASMDPKEKTPGHLLWTNMTPGGEANFLPQCVESVIEDALMYSYEYLILLACYTGNKLQSLQDTRSAALSSVKADYADQFTQTRTLTVVGFLDQEWSAGSVNAGSTAAYAYLRHGAPVHRGARNISRRYVLAAKIAMLLPPVGAEGKGARNLAPVALVISRHIVGPHGSAVRDNYSMPSMKVRVAATGVRKQNGDAEWSRTVKISSMERMVASLLRLPVGQRIRVACCHSKSPGRIQVFRGHVKSNYAGSTIIVTYDVDGEDVEEPFPPPCPWTAIAVQTMY